MNTLKNIGIHVLRSLLAAVFIYSSVTKVMSLELFEMYVYQHNPFSMLITAIGVRSLIGIEFLLGVLLLSNLFTRRVLLTIMGVLLFFSGFLAYQLIAGKEVGNCHCFGEVMPLDAVESLIKNMVMMGVAVLLMLLPLPEWKLRFRLPLLAALVILAGVLPNMLFPPDMFFKEKFTSEDRVGQRYEFEKIKNILPSGKKVDLAKGKKIVCMYSLHCIYCKLSAKKTTAIYNKMNPKPEIVYFFMGQTKDLDEFWTKSESLKFPNQIIDPSAFYELAGPELPIIYFLNNGIIVKQLHYSDAFDDDYISFMKE